MKFNVICPVAVLLFVVNSAQAQPQYSPEENCKKNVEETIRAIEAVQESTGRESTGRESTGRKSTGRKERMAGFTIVDIREIRSVKGDCAASEAIKRGQIDADQKNK
jgi:replication fork clamp-binding protein CrfC